MITLIATARHPSRPPRRLGPLIPCVAKFGLAGALLATPGLLAQSTAAKNDATEENPAAAAPAKPAEKKAASAPLFDGVQRLDVVEVSGEKIKPFTTANVDIPRSIDDVQPYFIFEAPAIDRSGATTVENFLQQRLTMNATQTVQEQSFFQGGVPSSVNLRGLGTNQTLILINGRRSTGGNSTGNFGTQPDLNTVPIGAVDRIEVLTASGSAIYGAGAVGGVINIVLKRNYAGGEVRHTYQNTFDSDTPIRRTDLMYGFSLEKGKTQVMLNASYNDTSVLWLQDRASFLVPYNQRVLTNNPSYSGYLTLGATSNIVGSPAPGTLLTLKSGGALNANSTFIPPGTSPTTSAATLGAGLLANAGKLNLNPADTGQIKGLRAPMGTPNSNKTYRVSIRREMTPKIELFTDFSYGATSTDKDDWSIGYSMSVPANAAINPFNQAVNLNVPYKGTKSPQSTLALTRAFTIGALVKLPRNWVGHADYTWSHGYNSFVSSGIGFNATEIGTAILAGTLNPFVDTQLYPLNMERFATYNKWFGYGTLNDVNLRLSGTVWRLPAGAPQVTIGLGRRQEGTASAPSYTEYPNFPARTTASMTLGKKQVTTSLYVEAQIPLIGEANKRWFARQLDLQVAGRVEAFNVTTGTASITLLPPPTTAPVILGNEAKYKSAKPTAGFSYKPIDDIMVRVSYSAGFVPPVYSQLLFNPTPSTTLTTVTDPRRGNTSRAVPTLSGGNPDLVPEESKTWNVGVVLQPKKIALLKGLRVNVEYYSIEKQNNIGTLAAQLLVENEALYPGRITRDPVPAGDPYAVGPITLVNLMGMNLFRAYNEGFDITVNYSRRTERYGGFDFSFNTTLPKHYKRKTVFNQPYLDYVNFPGSGPLAFRYNSTIAWDYRQWNAGWSTRYYGSGRVSGPPISTSLTNIQASGTDVTEQQWYHDLFAGYRFKSQGGPLNVLKGVELQVSVLNVFNKEPPFELGATSYWYSTWGSLRLREYRLALKKAF